MCVAVYHFIAIQQFTGVDPLGVSNIIHSFVRLNESLFPVIILLYWIVRSLLPKCVGLCAELIDN